MRDRGTTTRNWLWKLVLLLWVATPVFSASASSLRVLEQRHKVSVAGRQKLDRERFQLLNKVHKAAALITRLKADIKRGGFFGLPARLRLRYVRSRAQRLARQMEALETRLARQRKEVQAFRAQLRRGYLKKLRGLVKRHSSASRAEKDKLKRALARVRDRLRRLNPARKKSQRSIRMVMPKLNELDGPDELKQKTDALRDLEDRINRRLTRLRARASRLQRRAKQAKQDRTLLKDVNDMIRDDQVFDENSRRPRAVNNQPLKKKERQGPLRFPGVANSAPAATKGGGADSAAGQGAGEKSSPSPPPVGGPQGGSSFGGAGTQRTQPPTSSQQQRLSYLPGNPLGQKLQEPRWKGTPAQQLKALKAYKRRLLQQLQRVMRSKKTFSRRAKQLKKLDKRKPK